jgi:Zn-dependent protease
VALAGPLGNFVTALFFGLLLRFFPVQNETLVTLLALIVQINLILMIFNLVPIPPLDGSKVLAAFLPYEAQMKFFSLEKYGMILVIIFITFGFSFIVPIINFLFKLIVGGGV